MVFVFFVGEKFEMRHLFVGSRLDHRNDCLIADPVRLRGNKIVRAKIAWQKSKWQIDCGDVFRQNGWF